MQFIKQNTVDQVLKAFTETVERLTVIGEKTVSQIQDIDDLIDRKKEEQASLRIEANKAFKIRDKLIKLISE